MTGRNGRLRSVLRIRELAERRALGERAEAEHGAEAARRRMAARLDELQALTPPHRALTPLELGVLRLQGLAQHDLVLAATAEAELAEEHLAEVRRAWSLASVQRKSVERLVEQHRVDAAIEARSAADRALDEVVLLRRGGAR
jgi:hypothetical protein